MQSGCYWRGFFGAVPCRDWDWVIGDFSWGVVGPQRVASSFFNRLMIGLASTIAVRWVETLKPSICRRFSLIRKAIVNDVK